MAAASQAFGLGPVCDRYKIKSLRFDLLTVITVIHCTTITYKQTAAISPSSNLLSVCINFLHSFIANTFWDHPFGNIVPKQPINFTYGNTTTECLPVRWLLTNCRQERWQCLMMQPYLQQSESTPTASHEPHQLSHPRHREHELPIHDQHLGKTRYDFASHSDIIRHFGWKYFREIKCTGTDTRRGQRHLAKAAPNDPAHTARGLHCTRCRQFKPHDRQTDRQTPQTSVRILSISCIRCSLRTEYTT